MVQSKADSRIVGLDLRSGAGGRVPAAWKRISPSDRLRTRALVTLLALRARARTHTTTHPHTHTHTHTHTHRTGARLKGEPEASYTVHSRRLSRRAHRTSI